MGEFRGNKQIISAKQNQNIKEALTEASSILNIWRENRAIVLKPKEEMAIYKGSFENEGLKNEDRSTKHPNLENEAPKTRKRSTQNSKTKHPKLETCLSFKNTWQSLVKSPMPTQQKSNTITNRMQFKTIQVELRGVAIGHFGVA